MALSCIIRIPITDEICGKIASKLDVNQETIKNLFSQDDIQQKIQDDESLLDNVDSLSEIISNKLLFEGIEKEVPSELYEDAINFWQNDTDNGKIEVNNNDDWALNFIETAYQLLGKDNVVLYRNKSNSKTIIRFAKPTKGNSLLTEENKDIENISPLDKAKNIMLELHERNVARMGEFNGVEYIKGADLTVTDLANGRTDKSQRKPIDDRDIPKITLGNTADQILKDFFDGQLEESYSNLTQKQLQNLIFDLQWLKQQFDNMFGGSNNYKIYVKPKDVAVAGLVNIEGKNKLISGVPDIIICDKEGNFLIFDLKTTAKKYGIDLNIESYQKQLLYYAILLEKEFPELKGKIKIGGLIALHTNYASPYSTSAMYSKDENDNLYVSDAKDEEVEKKKLTEDDLYNGIRLDLNEPFVELTVRDSEYEFSSIERKRTEPKKEIEELENDDENLEEYETSKYYDNLIVTPEERHYIATNLMKYMSDIVSLFLNDNDFFHEEFPEYEKINIANMSRKDFINLVGFDKLIDYCISLDFISGESDIMQWVKDNKKFIKEEGFQTLIEIEDCSVSAKKAESVVYDGVDNSIENEVEDMETNEREYWTVNFRNVSSKAGLSKIIRRELSMMHNYEIDEYGNLKKVVDKFGMYNYVDGNMAKNTLQIWLSHCTTIEEMIEVLKQKLPQNLWLVDLVGYETEDDEGKITKIKEGLLDKNDGFKQLFFVNFRKNETRYSVVRVSFDKDGNRVYKTFIVNMKPLAKILLDDVIFQIENGNAAGDNNIVKDRIGGEIYFNEDLLNEVASIFNRLNVVYKRQGIRQQKKFFETNKEDIAKLYNLLGIKVSSDEVVDTYYNQKDTKKRNVNNTAFGKTLYEIEDLIKKMSNHKKSYDAYRPFEKGGEDNLYFNYKNLIEPFTDVLKTAIEASSYENGKTYYSFQPPSEIMNIFENLRNERGLDTSTENGQSEYEQFLSEKYGQSSWYFDKRTGEYKLKWLQKAGTESCQKDGLFEHCVQIHFNGKDYKDLNPIEITLAHIAEYMSDFWDVNRHFNPRRDRERERKGCNTYGDEKAKVRYMSGAKTALYHVPIYSDKNSNDYVRFYRYGKDEIINGFYDIVLQEIQRIRLVIDRALEDTEVKRDDFDISKDFIEKNKTLFDKIKKSRTINVSEGIDYDEEGNPIDVETTRFDISLDDMAKILVNGAKFHFIPELNYEILNKTELGQMLVDQINGVSKNRYSEDLEDYENEGNDDFVLKTKDFIGSVLDEYCKEEIEHFKSIGLYEKDSRAFRVGLIDREDTSKKENYITLPFYLHWNSTIIESPVKYFEQALKNVKNADGTKIRFVDEIYDDDGNIREEILEEYFKLMNSDIEYRLNDYIRNSVFATANIIELTAVDLAYFSSAESFQKRFAAWHSPGIRPEINATFDDNGKQRKYSADGRCRIMHVSDEISKSEIKEIVRQIFKNKASTIEDTIEKRDFEILADSIVNLFDKVDETDGQGYSSLTGFKKKMGMFGRWGKDKEEVYKKIREGEYTTEDLMVFVELLKPHICANLLKANDSNIMSKSYVPTEIKDSEYLLLLADALMRSEKKNTKLTALYDFMEESAFDNGIYNGKGIDSITFHSTQKFGAEGCVDLSDKNIDKYMQEKGITDRYKAIKDLLRSKIYYDADLTETDFEENDNSRYDKRYVSEFSFEHFALLQEVPNHMVDHRQSEGSQVRILKITDINPQTVFNVGGKEKLTGKEIQDETQKLTADLIEEAMDKLLKEFKVDAKNPLTRKRKLSKILQENILKDQRYDRDLLESVRINPQTGDFNIPLGDPIQAVRVQNLIYSIIKKRINKIDVTGGPTVQVSPFGLSDKLGIVFKRSNGERLMSFSEFKNKKGIIDDKKAVAEFYEYLGEDYELDCFECYCTCPSEKLQKHLTNMSKKNGKDYFHDLELAIKDGIIPEDKLKTIGYRIPTEGKYSIIPMKIKGFLPSFAGNAVIMPKEITLLTGADFDIDKMYMMFKKYELIGGEHRNEDFFDLTDSQLKQAWDDFYTKTEKGKELSKEIEDTKENAFKDWVITNTMKYGKFKGANEENLRSLFEKEAKKHGLDRNYKWIEGVQESFNTWLKENYTDYTEVEEKEVELPHFEEYEKEKKRNRLFDLHWTVATNKEMLPQLFTPGNFDNYKKMSCIMQILDGKNGNTIDYNQYQKLIKMSLSELETLAQSEKKHYLLPSTQEYFHKQNMVAKKMIGIFANNNVSHGFLQMQDIRLNLGEDMDGMPIMFTFDGKKLQSGDRLDDIYARDGITYISSVLASGIQASVDAIKFPTLENNNINTVTAPVINFLIRIGYDFEAIMLFVNQPIIKELVKIYHTENMKSYQSVDSIINYMTKQLTLDADERDILRDIDIKIEDETLQELNKDVYETDFTKESLINYRNFKDENNVIFQLKCLKLFKSFSSIGNQLNQLTFLTKYNSVTNAAGPTDSYTTVMLQRENEFYKLYDDGKNYFSENAKYVINNSQILRAFYESTVGKNGAANRIMMEYFFGISDSFISLVNQFSNLIPTLLDVKTLTSFKNDALFFKLTKTLDNGDAVFNMSETRRNYLIYELPDKVKKIALRLAKKGQDNLLLSKLSYDKIANDIEVINLRTGQYDSFEIEKLKDAWCSLLENDDEEVQQIAIDLFDYNLLRNTFGFSPVTFLNASSVKLKKSIKGYIEALKDADYNNGVLTVYGQEFIKLFMRNHHTNSKIVPALREKEVKEITEDVNSLEITIEKNKLKPRIVLNNKIEDVNSYSPIIKYKGKLYEIDSTEEVDDETFIVNYTLTTPLGSKNNFVEYNANEDYSEFESVIFNGYYDSVYEEEDNDNDEDDVERGERTNSDMNNRNESTSEVADEGITVDKLVEEYEKIDEQTRNTFESGLNDKLKGFLKGNGITKGKAYIERVISIANALLRNENTNDTIKEAADTIKKEVEQIKKDFCN